MQQCLMINAWLMGALGVLLPLFIQSRLEATARRQFCAQRRQRGGDRGEQDEPLLHDQQPIEWSSLYCSSFLVWVVVDVAYSLRLQTAH